MGNARKVIAVDAHVGSRLRLLRMQRGMSQSALGECAGITFQQVQKYERGTNRISASRLWVFADVLDVDVGFFFDGIEIRKPESLEHDTREADATEAMMQSSYGLKLCAAVSKIRSKEQRRNLLSLAKSMGDTSA